MATDHADLAAGRPVLAPAEVARFAGIAEDPLVHTPVPVPGDSPATVFFTSGTTGRPKAARHPTAPPSGCSRTARSWTSTPPPSCRWRRPSRGTSGSLTGDLWSVLINGGCSVVIEEDFLLPARLREIVARDGVNTVFLTPTLFNMFVEEDIEAFADVRAGHRQR